MTADERRKNTRVLFHTTVDLRFVDASYLSCATDNLSTKGVFVENVPGRALGEECDIVLNLTGSAEDLSLAMHGEIVRRTENGIGIHFKAMDLDSFSHLRQIIYYNSPDPDALDEDYLEE